LHAVKNLYDEIALQSTLQIGNSEQALMLLPAPPASHLTYDRVAVDPSKVGLL